MYLINKDTNRIEKIEEKTFSELGFRERENLQEWIANVPSCLGEDLLIIQKEFDGFLDTRERLDLLALDRDGNLVIIENKLDDTGRNVTWQALKYASYCASLTKENIRQIYQGFLDKQGKNEIAEDKLIDFFDVNEYDDLILNKGISQRIILIAGKFRKEVTSTVLLLMNYNLRIKCIKVTLYKLGEQLFLTTEQIIPMKDAEDYVIKMAEKTQDDISNEIKKKSNDAMNLEFWTILIEKMNKESQLLQNIHPRKSSCLSVGAGISGVEYHFVIAQSYVRVQLNIKTGDEDKNKDIYDYLFEHKKTIENEFGKNLEWEKSDEKKTCKIYDKTSKNCYNKDEWNGVIDFLVDGMIKLHRALNNYLKAYKNNMVNL